MQSHARDRPAVVPCNDRGASHRLAGEDGRFVQGDASESLCTEWAMAKLGPA
jgi:hypothetical protein